jgi:hypothetical protein
MQCAPNYSGVTGCRAAVWRYTSHIVYELRADKVRKLDTWCGSQQPNHGGLHTFGRGARDEAGQARIEGPRVHVAYICGQEERRRHLGIELLRANVLECA